MGFLNTLLIEISVQKITDLVQLLPVVFQISIYIIVLVIFLWSIRRKKN